MSQRVLTNHSLSFCLLLANNPSLLVRCVSQRVLTNHSLDRARPCYCDSSCLHLSDCCSDYHQFCTNTDFKDGEINLKKYKRTILNGLYPIIHLFFRIYCAVSSFRKDHKIPQKYEYVPLLILRFLCAVTLKSYLKRFTEGSLLQTLFINFANYYTVQPRKMTENQERKDFVENKLKKIMTPVKKVPFLLIFFFTICETNI